MQAFFFEPPLENNFIGHQMAEVYKEQVYAPLLLGKKDLTILDVGANIGITAYYFSQFAKKVYAIEPSAEHFNCLFEMIKYNKLENKITPIKKALFINSDKLPLFHNRNKTMYSLHMAVNDNSTPFEVVDCITLDKLFKEYKIEIVDLMKLDIEGSEVELLSGEGFRKIADRIRTILLESHTWSDRNPNQLIDVLHTRGFTTEGIQADANIIVAKRI